MSAAFGLSIDDRALAISLDHPGISAKRIEKTLTELVHERDAVKHLL